jgi:hypothetical protein
MVEVERFQVLLGRQVQGEGLCLNVIRRKPGA